MFNTPGTVKVCVVEYETGNVFQHRTGGTWHKSAACVDGDKISQRDAKGFAATAMTRLRSMA